MILPLLILESIGSSELLVVFVVALVVFGPRRLPELGRMLGKSLNEFKRASDDFKRTWEMEVEVEKAQAKSRQPEDLAALENQVAQEQHAAAPLLTTHDINSSNGDVTTDAPAAVTTSPPTIEEHSIHSSPAPYSSAPLVATPAEATVARDSRPRTAEVTPPSNSTLMPTPDSHAPETAI